MAWDKGFEAAFSPRSVAIVGVTRDVSQVAQPLGGGIRFISHLKSLGFQGNIYPVNPNASDILGLRAYPNLSSIPEPIDLVIVSVPAPFVPQVLEECARVGAKNVFVFTAGFRESGEPNGAKLEERIADIAAKGGLRILGPNCMGFHIPKARFSTLIDYPSKDGAVSFLSQSGGLAVEYIQQVGNRGIGLSKVISYGNALLMDGTDFLQYLREDPETRFVGMYMEGTKDGRKLLELVHETNRTRPVVIWKGGLTKWGTKAVASHTASLAGEEGIWDAFFKQTGATRVDSLDELVDATVAFMRLHSLNGKGVALIGGGGGNSVAFSDTCSREGLEVPTFSQKTQDTLRDFIPVAGASIRNPVDAGRVLRDKALLERTIGALAADPSISAVVVGYRMGYDSVSEADEETFAECISSMATEKPNGKPVIAVLSYSGRNLQVSGRMARMESRFIEAGVAFYPSLARASRALAKLAQYRRSQT